ncbi:hypothetical protein AVL61_12070 [Kocuria rosea subsp. polaris]|uniref:Uncharacterized protein n=1 Tax=Kocuria rosea subsp. polaris TaxID=136273 RepID=A0A0W8I4Z0_KOCRO|nr:hypothetical protein [Kocuria polaris]KUG52954.1 hypothetical protein AVL61_12070 [Kocuria polaris]
MGDNATVETVFELIFLLPYLIGPALLVALISVAAPVFRRRQPVSAGRRTAAVIFSLLCLFWAFQLIGWVLDLGVYGIALMTALVASAAATLIQLGRTPAAGPSGSLPAPGDG